MKEWILDMMPFIRPFPGERINARPSHTPKKTILLPPISLEGELNLARNLISQADGWRKAYPSPPLFSPAPERHLLISIAHDLNDFGFSSKSRGSKAFIYLLLFFVPRIYACFISVPFFVTGMQTFFIRRSFGSCYYLSSGASQNRERKKTSQFLDLTVSNITSH